MLAPRVPLCFPPSRFSRPLVSCVYGKVCGMKIDAMIRGWGDERKPCGEQASKGRGSNKRIDDVRFDRLFPFLLRF